MKFARKRQHHSSFEDPHNEDEFAYFKHITVNVIPHFHMKYVGNTDSARIEYNLRNVDFHL